MSRSFAFCSSNPALLALALLVLLSSCGRGRGRADMSEEPPRDGQILVDAYFFDVKASIDNHPRTIRLQLFFADSVALITARGYLGKGVGKGVWRPDSTVFYSPTDGRYFVGSLDSVAGASCVHGARLQRTLADLLSGDPARILNIPGIQLIERDKNNLKTLLDLGDCENPLELDFDRQGKGEHFYLEEFRYFNRDGKRLLRAQRRTIKLAKKLDTRKLILDIPEDAEPMSW